MFMMSDDTENFIECYSYGTINFLIGLLLIPKELCET